MFLAALAMLGAFACATSRPHEGLVGTWKLVEYWDRASADQPKDYKYGQPPLGFIVYDAAGHVFVQFASKTEYVAYFGTYTVDAAKSIVTHHVQSDVTGKYTGTDQLRPFHLDGDELVIGDGKTWLRRLVRVNARTD